jgi:cell wall assembly regulator SMI1
VPEPTPLTLALLDELGALWQRHGMPVARRLTPGLTDAEIDALASPLGLRVPAEARTWWRWHNGAHDTSILTSGGKEYSSLERCLGSVAEMRGIAREVTRPYRLSTSEAEEMERGVWNWDWLPLCADGVGGMLVVDAAAGTPAREQCPVRYRTRDDGSNAALVAPSIGALVHEWIRALAEGTGSYDEREDRWTLDFETLPPGFDHRLL